MKEIRSLTVSRELVERLRTLMCCSGSQESCRDDGFCGSDAGSWPVVPNGTPKTRMTYPEDDEKPSIPDVEGFCDAYMTWYTQSNCGALAKEIAQGLAVGGRCAVDADVEDFTARILKNVPRKNRADVEALLKQQYMWVVGPAVQQCLTYEERIRSLEQLLGERCEILYDRDEFDVMRFNEDRAEALGDIAGFCQQVQIDDNSGFNWKKYGGGSAVTAAGVGALYYLGKTLRGLYRFLRGVKEIDESTAGAARGLKRFFSYSLPNLGRSIAYVLSGGWMHGKKPPRDLPDPTATKPATTTGTSNGAAVTADPRVDVVVVQLRNLTQSKRYAKEGERFVSLSEPAQRSLAATVIDQWNRETEEKQKLYLEDDARPLAGKIPIGYLIKFAKRYLKPEMLPLIEASAGQSAPMGILPASLAADAAAPSPVQPTVDGVYRQLVHDDRYNRAGPAVQEYLARQAIAKWEELAPDAKASFRPEETPFDGALPQHFIRFFRKKMIAHPRGLEQHATVFLQILSGVPELAGVSFQIIDRRTKLLVNAWRGLSDAVRGAFELQDGASRLPHDPKGIPATFIQHLRPALKVGVLPRDTLLPADQPWEPEDSAPFPHMGFDLRMVMSELVRRDAQAAYYPVQLGRRARSIVEAWVALTPAIRARFMEQAVPGEIPPPLLIAQAWIPESYISLWYMVSPGIGLTSREPDADRETTPATARAVMGREDDDEGSGSTPKGGAAGSGAPQGTPQGATGAQGAAAQRSFAGIEMDDVAQPPETDPSAEIIAGAETLVGGEILAAGTMIPSAPPVGTTTAMTK